MPRLLLTFLGGFQARLDAGPLVTVSSRKAQALLAYLALPSGRPHAREKLATLLGGDLRAELARTSLRQSLLVLRRALAPVSPPPLRLHGDTATLDPGAVDVDVAAFEAAAGAVDRPSLERAVRLYRGELLDGLRVQSEPFEAWLLVERERLRELAVETLARLLVHQRREGHTDLALRTALRLLALDPLQEAVHRAVMRLYVRLRRRGAALRQYNVCLDVLQRELGLDPEPRTRRLYQAILRRRVARRAAAEPGATPQLDRGPTGLEPRMLAGHSIATPLSDLPAALPLIGRAPELACLAAALADVRAGHGRLFTVVGEAGVGKTRLLAEVAAVAERDGDRVLVGRAWEPEQVLPFAPWVDAFRSGRVPDDLPVLEGLLPRWRGELTRLIPEISSAAPPVDSTDHRTLFEAVGALLARLAERQPLVLLLEDLHWADDMSVRLLAFVARRLHAWRLLVVATAREEELIDAPSARRTLDDLVAGGHSQQLRLGPLSEPETHTLVRQLAGTRFDSAALARLAAQSWATSSGNPFVVVEMCRALDEDGSRGTPGLGLPAGVQTLIARRLDCLGDPARQLLAVAAVIGRAFEFPLIARAAGLAEAVSAEALEELVRRRVLQDTGEGFDFTHDRIRQVAASMLLPARQAVLHRQTGEAIEAMHNSDLDPHASTLGRHFHAAGVWDKAVTYLGRAGVLALARWANREAAACFEEALDALAQLPQTRETLEQAIDLRLDLRPALGSLSRFGHLLERMREAEALAIRIGDRRRLGTVLATAHGMVRTIGSHEEAIYAGKRALALAHELQDEDLELRVEYNLGAAYWYAGEHPRALARFERVLRGLEADPARVRRIEVHPVFVRSMLASTHMDLGRFGEATAHAEAGARLAEAEGHPVLLIAACVQLGEARFATGDLRGAIPYFERALGLSRQWEIVDWGTDAATALGHAYALMGRVAEGLPLLEAAVAEETHTVMRGASSRCDGWAWGT